MNHAHAEATEHKLLTAELPGLIAARRPRVVVIGDAVLDEWLTGKARRVVAPGGAGNTAVNLAALGADVCLVSSVGDDAPGHELIGELNAAGVHTTGVSPEPDGRTVVKRRIVAADQVLLRVGDGDQQGPPVSKLRSLITGTDAVALCDSRPGPPDRRMLDALRALRDEIPFLVVDAHRLDRWQALQPDLVTPNAAEAEALLGSQPTGPRPEFVVSQQDRLLAETGAASVVVTLDRDGAVLLTGSEPAYRTWTRPAPAQQTAGAGDTFCAALTVARCCGLSPQLATELAQAAAEVVVHDPDTMVCGTAKLTERLAGYQGSFVDAERLAAIVAEHREAGHRVVFTNGCFDVLHRGHIGYLNQAKALGDLLIVAVNSDASAARLKGPGRPVNPLVDRAALLAALSCVDHVTVFDEDTPIGLLRALRPQIYAKGGDYSPEMLAETPVVQDYGGEVRILDYLPEHSTSAVIDRIKGAV